VSAPKFAPLADSWTPALPRLGFEFES